MKTVGSERVAKLREKVLTTPEICVERAYLFTESYKETESEPPVIRRAKALEKVLQEMTIGIEDGELIVGNATSKVRGGPLFPDIRHDWHLEELDTLSTRDWDRFLPLAEEDKVKIKEFLPYWKGKSLYEKWRAMIPESMMNLNHKVLSGGAFCDNGHHCGHVCVDYEKVLTKGLNDIEKQVEEQLGKLNLGEVRDFDKFQFLNAVNIVVAAAIGFAQRYAELATSLVEKETDAQRKSELEKIAEMCRWVPANPARSFHEALQSVWFVYIVLMIEGWGAGMSLGRPDQYLYPFYQKDMEEGRITREEACELISLLYIKWNGWVIPVSMDVAKAYGGFPLTANMTLGGITKNGKDAVNELSFLFLDADKDVRLNVEDFVISVHKNTPDAFLMKACEIARSQTGKLKFVSDETTIQQLLAEGKTIEYARDNVIIGCNGASVPGYSHDIPGAGLFNLPLMLELALNNGVSRITGERIGPATGNPRKFKSYEEVWTAYTKQVEAFIPVTQVYRNVDKQLFAEFAPTPFQSALFHGCIEKGLDITNGGTAPYMDSSTSLSGAPNVGDSLAAIKRAVFEDKKITMDTLIDALDKNFEGEEEVLHILKSAPKFGNDNDYVDSIVNEVLIHASNEVTKREGFAGSKAVACAVTVTANIPLGRAIGALPDGRRSGEPLSEGGISPHQGRNVSGPTATMKSVAKLDQVKLTGGSVLNMRFNPDALKDEAKIRKFVSLIRTFCEIGGHLVQFNIVSGDILKEAQRHPEKYRDLLVRVATYSAYFVELSAELQNDIIARMEFQEV